MTIRLLGPVDIRVGSAPLAVDTRKAVALLAHLAVVGRPVARESLAALLWPESDGTDARSALRRTLSVLSAALGGAGLAIDRAVVSVRPAEVSLDVTEFRAALAAVRRHGHGPDAGCPACLASLTDALALNRGEFMAGFALRDSDAFDDWQLGEAEAYQRELDGALERLARGRAAAGRWEAAIEAGRRWLELDPLHEPAHRLLMLVLARAGETAAALRQYRACVRVLDQELGVSPLPETTELYDTIGSGRIGSPSGEAVAGGDELEVRSRQAPPLARVASSATPLIGRERELGLLVSRPHIEAGRGRLITVSGEAGIGKSRLVTTAAEQTAEAGAVVLVARCHHGEEGIAFGVVVELLAAALRAPGGADRIERLRPDVRAEAARLVPELGGMSDAPRGSSPGTEPPESPARFTRGVVDALVGLVAGLSPGLLVVEDVQWADPSSLDVLGYLVRRLGERSITLILTWRPEDLPTTGGLRVLVADAERLEVIESIALGRLDMAAVTELARAIQPSIAAVDADRLFAASEGLPLFVIEYLAASADEASRGSGTDARSPVVEWNGDESRSFTGGARAGATPRAVEALIQSRLSAVGDTAAQLVTAAAVIGRSFDLSTVRTASGRTEEETVDALEELVRRGLIRETGGDPEPTFDFSHGRIRDVAYGSTSLARRRLLHRRVAETLRGTRPAVDPFLWSVVARHLRDAGRDEESAAAYRLAGDHARSISANEEALDHYRSALALGHEDVLGLHLAIGDLQTLAGAYRAALASYEIGAALAERMDLGPVEHRLGLLAARQGDWSAAQRHLELALAEALADDTGPAAVIRTNGTRGSRSESDGLPDLHSSPSRILADLCLAIDRLGDAPMAQSRAEEALEAAIAASDGPAVARARSLLGMLARRRGALTEARQELESALNSEAGADPSTRIAALNNLALVAVEESAPEAGLQLWAQALELCVVQGDRHREAALHNNMADALHAAGREPEAMNHLKLAVAMFADIGERGSLEPAIWQLVDW